MRKLLAVVSGAVKTALLGLVYLYRITISPLFGSSCRFHPTCSTYAVEALKSKPLHTALFLTTKRILKCHPFNKGGYDPLK